MRTRLACLLLALALPAWGASVQLAWDYLDNPLAPASGFKIYRDTACLQQPVVLSTIPYLPQTTPTFTDQNAAPDLTYCYFVTALGTAGGESDRSNTVQFRVPPEEPELPFPPTHLRGTIVP